MVFDIDYHIAGEQDADVAFGSQRLIRQRRVAGAQYDVILKFLVEFLFEVLAHVYLGDDAETFFL